MGKRKKKRSAPRSKASPAPRPVRSSASRSPAARSTDAGEPAGATPGDPPPGEIGRGLGLATVSGCLWFLACADFDIWPLAYVAMVPSLFAIMRASTMRRALLFGWWTGLVANLGGFYWISGLLVRFAHLHISLGLLGLFLLAAYQGVVFLLFAWAIRRLREHSERIRGAPLPMVLLAPLVMVTFELVVPFIFPWYLAITQAWVTSVIQIAELTGPLGITAVLLVVNGAFYDALTEHERRRRLVPAVCAATTVAAVVAFGLIRIGQIEDRRASAPVLNVGVVQGNIPFDEKGIDRAELAARQLADLQRVSAELEAQGADLIVWTESSYPYAISRHAIGDFADESPHKIRRGFSAPLIFGAVTIDPTDRDKSPYNTALLLGSDGTYQARYDKIFLLMFGEYIPFYDTLPWIRKILPKQAGHFSRGEEIVPFALEKDGETYRLGPMICYEDILPAFGRKLAKFRPHLLVNITNDAWFGDTSEPWEHLALSVYRSVELRTDMVRSVNTGVSAFISATGEVMAETYAVDPKKTPKGVDGIVRPVVLMEGGHTVYAAVGDVFGYLCTAAMLLLWIVWPRLRRQKK